MSTRIELAFYLHVLKEMIIRLFVGKNSFPAVICKLTGFVHFFLFPCYTLSIQFMADYLGLLISITEGLSIPKKKVFLSVIRMRMCNNNIDSI